MNTSDVPEGATHRGPADDYWRIRLDHAERKAHADLWMDDEWVPQDDLFTQGLFELGIRFEPLAGMPELSREAIREAVRVAAERRAAAPLN